MGTKRRGTPRRGGAFTVAEHEARDALRAQGLKQCGRCKTVLPLASFFVEKRRKADGRAAWCKDCGNQYRRDLYRDSPEYRTTINARNRRNYEKDPVAHIERARKNIVKVKYGLTWDKYQEILAAQDGRCALCRTNEPRGHGAWHVDHDHVTGAIRGLLCHLCNTQLGVYVKLLRKFGPQRLRNYLARDLAKRDNHHALDSQRRRTSYQAGFFDEGSEAVG